MDRRERIGVAETMTRGNQVWIMNSGQGFRVYRNQLNVEFVGMPGSGKTTLARRLVETIQEEPSMVVTEQGPFARFGKKLKRAFTLLTFAATHPKYAKEIHDVVASTRQESLRDYLILVANWILCLRRTKVRQSKLGIEVIDQGLFQMVWSTAFSGRREETLRLAWTLAERLHSTDILVIVKAPLESIVKRLSNRPGRQSRLEARLANEPWLLDKAKTLMDGIEELILNFAKENPTTRVLEVYNSGPEGIDDSVRRILNEINFLTNTGSR